MIKSQKCNGFTVNEIEPKGWLLEQLKIQATSLSGNLDKIWPDIKDSKYIGGDKDGWERVPYWLDGFIPLAYLLKNDDMIARSKRYIDAILDRQQDDGWLCPCSDEERSKYDMWALLLLSKVLVLYYDCSNDERIEPALYKAFKNFYRHLKEYPIFDWGKFRWFEGLIAIYWLYERVHEEWLLELADTLCEQGADYKALFSGTKLHDSVDAWTLDTHVVNMAMAIKLDALMSRRAGNDGGEFAEKMFSTLMRYHGTAVGHFNGDECLAPGSPIRGTELCGVVEAMYSYEVLFSVTGNKVWLDRLELLAYNALPAAISPDMWTHQYDQIVNQIACVSFEDKSIFGTNVGESNLFGLEPGYGCCTANFNQGWPKFALSTFFKSEKGIVSAVLAPSKVTTDVEGIKVSVELETLYPFRNKLCYTVKTEKDVTFELAIRVPEWVTEITVNGTDYKKENFIRINKLWSGTQTVTIEFDFETIFEKRPENMVCLRRGALCYSVAIDEEWQKKEYTKDGVERVFPYCDYILYPKSKWNYAYFNSDIEVKENDNYDKPFSSTNPPISITANMVEIDWRFEEGFPNVCARIPYSREPISDVQKVVLHPYGCTNLRITEVPKLN